MSMILLIEDDQRMASLIKRGMEEEHYTVDHALYCTTGRQLAMAKTYSVIIMDIMLPDGNGLSLCEQIKIAKPDVPVIMLTALGSTDDRLGGFNAGADDYLPKPFDLRELVARIKVLSKRNQISSQIILQKADLELNIKTQIVKRGGKEINLTRKEFRLLQYMMENSDRVLSRVEIGEKVWDTSIETGTNFIDVYINYLRNKIDKDHPIKLIHTRPGLGFIFRDESYK